MTRPQPPKPTNDVPADVTNVGTQSAEEMVDSILLDSPLPDVAEERRKPEKIPIGEPIVPPPPNLDFLPFARPFYSRNFSLGPQNQEDPVREIAAAPHKGVEALLVVGASTSAIASGSAPPQVDRIKLA